MAVPEPKAAIVKQILRWRGCDLPFYCGIDSYRDEFHRIRDWALKGHPSLLGIHEVNEEEYGDDDWPSNKYTGFTQVELDEDVVVPGYGTSEQPITHKGVTSFLQSGAEIRSVIRLLDNVGTGACQLDDDEYGIKCLTLLHEIGHVDDMEKAANIDCIAKRWRVIDSEVYADLYCIEHAAKRCFRRPLRGHDRWLREAAANGGYLATVAQKVIERAPSHSVLSWHDYYANNPSPRELQELGPEAEAILRGSSI